MKTVLVIYLNGKTPLTNRKEIATAKKYCFNIEEEVEEGDLIDSPEYSGRMQIVKVLDTKYKYYNNVTGKISSRFNSTTQWEIRQLKLQELNDNVIYGHKVTV